MEIADYPMPIADEENFHLGVGNWQLAMGNSPVT